MPPEILLKLLSQSLPQIKPSACHLHYCSNLCLISLVYLYPLRKVIFLNSKFALETSLLKLPMIPHCYQIKCKVVWNTKFFTIWPLSTFPISSLCIHFSLYIYNISVSSTRLRALWGQTPWYIVHLCIPWFWLAQYRYYNNQEILNWMSRISCLKLFTSWFFHW